MSSEIPRIANRIRDALHAYFPAQAGTVIKAYLVESADPTEQWAVRVHKTTAPQMVFVVGQKLWKERDFGEVVRWLQDDMRLLTDHYPDDAILYLYYLRPEDGTPVAIQTSLVTNAAKLNAILTPVLAEIV